MGFPLRFASVISRPSSWLVLAVLVASAGWIACAGGTPMGPAFEPAAPPSTHRALVYLYRIDRVGGVGPMRVRLDGGSSFELRNGEYAPLEVRAGGRKLQLALMWIGGVARGWSSIPFTARPGSTLYVRVWAGTEELDRGPEGLPDDFAAPGRGDRYAGVNVYGAVWADAESERDIRDLQLAPKLPKGAL